MGSNTILLSLAVFVIFQCYEVNSEEFSRVELQGPPLIDPDHSSPVLKAGYMVQQVINKIDYVGQIYFDKSDYDLLIFTNRVVNGTVTGWLNDFTYISQDYVKELQNELFAFVIAIADSLSGLIFASDRNLRYYEINDTDYRINKPYIRFKDPGFVIYSAHCDNNGNMFILLIGKTKETKNLGKLYKTENNTATLIRTFNTTPRDFRFDEKCTSMYMVNDNGRKIIQIKYDLKTTKLGNATDIFDKDKYPALKNNMLKSVVADKNGHLWVSAAGKEGLVLEINPLNKTIVTIIPVPSKDLTFVTFGLPKYNALFVGSKGSCTKGFAQGAIYSITGMGVEGVPDNPIKNIDYDGFPEIQ